MAHMWNKKLETGNVTIDAQHKELINAINELLSACSVGKGREQIKKTSQFLLDYTSRHFAAEEKLQIQSNYPDYINHKRYHDEFVKVVKNIVAQLKEEGPTLGMVAKINNVIAAWLINHITREDIKVAEHIKNSSK